jgi:ATP-binding cassette subfamily B protein
MKKKTGILRLLEISGQEPFKLIFASLLALVSTLSELAPYIITHRISLNLLSANLDIEMIIYLAKIGIGFTIFRGLTLYISIVISHIAAYEILYGLRKQLAEKLGRLPLGFFTQNTQGAIKGILNEDVERIEIFIAHRIPDLTSAVISPIVAFLYLTTLSVRMALVLLIPLAIVMFCMSRTYMMDDRQNLFGEWMRALEKMNGTIVEYVRGMPVVKVFNQTTESFTRFTNAVRGYTDNTLDWSKKTVHWWGIGIVFMTSGLSIILPFGVWFYLRGSLPLLSLILFLFLGVKYLLPMIKLSNFIGFLSMVTEGVEKIDSILETPEIPETNSPRIPNDHQVEFKNVTFDYGKGEVLRNISFKVPERSFTALVGPSGSGKTTITSLIPRFWDVTGGEILIGGVNIKDIETEDLLSYVSMVFQDVYLFNDTIYNNIKIGKKDATREEIIDASKAAQCHEFIMKLPDGYETLVGEGGSTLSGGEKQRVSIARAILKDAPIVLLDEATASLDPENEIYILRAIDELVKSKTLVVIAHRFATIIRADNILVLENGEIIERGKHGELVEAGGLYQRFWEEQ